MAATIFAQRWGPAVATAGHIQIPELLLKHWKTIGLSRCERENIIYIIRYQDHPAYGAVPSAKALAEASGVSYATTRKNLKRLCAPVLDAGGTALRALLLVPILCKRGIIRYSLTPLRYALERAEKALPIVKPRPKPQPVPDPAAEVEVEAEAEAILEEEYKDVQFARDEWDTIRVALARDATNGQLHWLSAANARGWRENILVVASNNRIAIEMLQKKFLHAAQYLLNQRWRDCLIQFEFIDRRRGPIVGSTVQALSFGGG